MTQENNKQVNNFQEIKNRIDFKEFYSQFSDLDLKQSSNNTAWSCCPFHNETTASLQINYSLGTWHCFGSCQEGGDVFDFYQKYYNVSKSKAMFDIAKEINYEIIMDNNLKELSEQKKKFFNFSARLHKFFKDCLEEDDDCKQYLINREISQTSIKRFGIGAYVPNKIMSFITEKDVDIALDIGVIKYDDNGELRPVNYNKRITFPYIENKVVLTFTSRAIDKDIMPKYLNFKNNSICDKNELLYGIHKASEKIKKTKAVFICEGNLDAISANANGIENIIALSGLKPSDNQLYKLKKYNVKNFGIIVEDKAILTKNKMFSLQPLQELCDKIKSIYPFANIKIIKTFKEDKCDLDDYFKLYNFKDFVKLERESKLHNKFMIDMILDNANIKTIEDKSKYVAILKPHIYSIKNTIDRSQYITYISSRLQLPENDIYTALKKYDKVKTQESMNTIPKIYDSRYSLIQKTIPIIFIMDYSQSKMHEVLQKYNVVQYFEEAYADIYEIFYKLYKQNIQSDKIIEFATSTHITNQAIVNEIIMRSKSFSISEDELEEFIKVQHNYLKSIKR